MSSSMKRKKSKIDNEMNYLSTSNGLYLELEKGKRYAHTAPCSYKIMMASLQPDDRKQPNCACNLINKGRQNQDEDKVSVIVEHDLKEFILCTLDSRRLQQCKLNIKFKPGEQVAFRTIGKTSVLLSGRFYNGNQAGKNS